MSLALSKLRLLQAAAVMAAFCCVALAFVPTILASPVHRDDLVAPLGKLICSKVRLTTSQAWKEGIESAQIVGEIVNAFVKNQVPEGSAEKTVARQAELLAKHSRLLGYATGRCDEHHYWMARLPAPAPLAFKGSEVTLPMDSMNRHCNEVEVLWTRLKGGAAAPLKFDGSGRLRLPDESGTLSVTCQPKEPAWLGKQEWYFLPTGRGPEQEVPEQEMLTDGVLPAEALITWINSLRRLENLAPLNWADKSMKHAADSLSVGAQLAHDRRALKLVADRLRTEKKILRGENRVEAVDLRELAWLLWNSPPHRTLLLDPSADLGGLVVNRQIDGLFAVIALAKAGRLDVAKRP